MLRRVWSILLSCSLIGACASTTDDGAPTASVAPTDDGTPTASVAPTDQPTAPAPSPAPSPSATSAPPAPATPPNASIGPPGSGSTPDRARPFDCARLRTAGFETRRELLAEESPGRIDELASDCADLVEVTIQAAALADRVAAVPATTIADLNGTFSCTSTSFEFTVTNDLDIAIGYYLIADIRPGPDVPKAEALSAAAPAVVWRLDPGATTTTTGTFPENDGFTACSVAGSVFVADTDGLTGDPNPPTEAAQEPAERWFLALLERQAAHEAAPSPDGVSRFEDLRSRSYAALVEAAAESEPVGGDAVRRYAICDVQPSPEPHLTALVYERDQPAVDAGTDPTGDGTDLAVGVFRRGHDGVWRWLGPALEFRSGLDSCDDYFATNA